MASFHIVLIRGIGGPSHALITMKELAQAVTHAGVGEVRSVLATGNFVVRSDLPAAAIAAHFDAEMRRRKLVRPLVMRTPAQLGKAMKAGAAYPATNERPARVLMHFFEGPIGQAAVAKINARATIEQAFLVAGELLVDFADDTGAPVMTLDAFERCAGMTGTGRNWNTLDKILKAAMAMGWAAPRWRLAQASSCT